MLLHKIFQTVRNEGLRGLWVRLKYRPKATPTTPDLILPFRVTGADPRLVSCLSSALRELLGPNSLSDRDAETTLHISPSPEHTLLGAHDVVYFADTTTALDFLKYHGKLSAQIQFLLPSSASLQAFRQAGVRDAQIFLFSADASDTPGLINDMARWLLTAGLISPQDADPGIFPALSLLRPHDRLCLSLPEDLERREGFTQIGLGSFRIVDGIRISPGWQGCGWSYATIARAALAQDAAPILVCEDDMRPAPEFRKRLTEVERYLEGQKGWDVFSGLVSNISEDCIIHHVEQHGELTFIHLNFTTGMVLNIYTERALERLSQWRPNRGSIQTNTIDAWLGQLPNLHVITTLPFLARHDTEATSSVFGFSSRRYESLLRSSEKRLTKMVAKYQHQNNGQNR